MKKLFIIAFACIVAASAVAHTVANTLPIKAAFNWKKTTHDFGAIPQGSPVTHEFTFTNSGSEALIITNVHAPCGCTVAEYTQTPIAPGEKGFVKATYNAASMGVFTKTVSIHANSDEGAVQLTIKGEVIAAMQ